jgi:hypothetical protein
MEKHLSSQGVDNGCYGFFKTPIHYKAPIISVPRTGSIGEAFVQTNDCSVDDNCLVLIPKQIMSLDYLFYICVMIRKTKWRYMYGRQITPTRLETLSVLDPKKFNYSVMLDVIKEIRNQMNKKIEDI